MLIAVAAMFTGCSDNSGGPLGPVSGTVTLDGKPLVGVEVVFSPMATEGNSNPGVYSFGTTDESGHYELKTRHGKTGAIVGKHSVTIEYPDGIDMTELQEELADAKNDEEADAEEVKARMAEAEKKLKGRPMIPESANQEIEVPKGGNTDANFELTSGK